MARLFSIPFLLLLALAMAEAAQRCQANFKQRKQMQQLHVNAEITNYTMECRHSGSSRGCRVLWFRGNEQLRFASDGICATQPYLWSSSSGRHLTVLRASPELSGEFACVLADARSNSSDFADSESRVRRFRFHVHPELQPSTQRFLENLAPSNAKDLEPERPYLSWRIAEMQAPTAAAGGRQLSPFRMRFLLLRLSAKAPTPVVEWLRLGDASRWSEIGDGDGYEVGELRGVSCDRHDGLFRTGADERGLVEGLRCFESTLCAVRGDRSTIGDYDAVVRVGNRTLRHPFRLDLAAKNFGQRPLKATELRFSQNRSLCVGQPLLLSCEAEAEADGGVVVSIRRNGTVVAEAGGRGRVTARLLRNVSVAADAGVYGCRAEPLSLLHRTADAVMGLSVRTDCTRFGDHADSAASLYALSSVLICLYVAVAMATVFCVVNFVRRRRSPIVKRIRVLPLFDSQQQQQQQQQQQAYRSRHQSGSLAPLLASRQASLEAPATPTVPEVVVETIDRRSSDGGKSSNREIRYAIPACPVLEVQRNRLLFAKKIGEGAFGSVFSGQLLTAAGKTRDVAIKQLKAGYTEEELVAIVKEMEVMKMLRGSLAHPNIISIVGVCTKSGPFLLLTELAHHGNLREFLVDRRPLQEEKQQQQQQQQQLQLLEAAYRNLRPGTRDVLVMPTVAYRQLVAFAEDVAAGLEFMASIGIVHRDIAARNILVAGRSDGAEGLVAKISDFGLTRQVKQEKDYYRMLNEGKLPVKWLAPESLRHRLFTSKSDVWSYGVLLYEIFSFGQTPYPGIPADCAAEFVMQGGRNSCPPFASKEAYQLMIDCWHEEQGKRPAMEQIRHRLAKLGD